uniref:Ubiquitin carboxyl-terminal hydrolase n=1 Tax=Parastrongyloides trichosuri TaxID=131310 RepID=A0A0N4Z2D5_PARTI
MSNVKIEEISPNIKSQSISQSHDISSIGLPNNGNTCYLNAVIQVLYHSKLFRYEVRQVTEIMKENIEFRRPSKNIQKAAQTIESLNRLFSSLKLKSTQGLSYFASMFKTLKPTFSINCQQDAQEFLSYILEALDDCKEYLHSIDKSLRLTSTFGGTITKHIICEKCRKRMSNIENFNILTIPVDTSYDKNDSKYGAWSLARWSALEILDGDNKYECNYCNSKQKAFMFPWINNKPSTLILHICRFNVISNNNTLTNFLKYNVTEKVKSTFPVPFFLPLIHHYFHGEYRNDEYYKHMLQKYESPELIEDQYYNENLLKQTYAGYYLNSMILHIGKNINCGHYVAAIRSQDNPLKWNIYDDNVINKVNILDIFKNCMYSPYIIFYEKVV